MLNNLPASVRQHLAALRALVVLTVVTGFAYPLVILVVAQLPGLKTHADGSLVKANGTVVGSSLLGQSFTDAKGNPITKYFQTRPSDAGAGYDPTASAGSNLGPESIIDTLPDPSNSKDTGKQSLLTQVCSRSMAVGQLESVDGQRPVLHERRHRRRALGHPRHWVDRPGQERGVGQPGVPGEALHRDLRRRDRDVRHLRRRLPDRQIVLVRGPGKGTDNPVPPDAVTASGSGLDPDISVAYANLQAPRVAKVRGISLEQVHSSSASTRSAGRWAFMGNPGVDVLQLNLALDKLSGAT